MEVADGHGPTQDEDAIRDAREHLQELTTDFDVTLNGVWLEWGFVNNSDDSN